MFVSPERLAVVKFGGLISFGTKNEVGGVDCGCFGVHFYDDDLKNSLVGIPVN